MAEIDVSKLQELIDGSSNIVFFGGAGVSTESGIKDFRSVDGLYNQKYDYPPETMLSHTFFVRHKEEFFRFYNDKLLEKTVGTDAVERALPNKAHYKLAELEKAGKAVIMKLSSRSCSLRHIAMGQDPAERNAAFARLPGAMLETR